MAEKEGKRVLVCGGRSYHDGVAVFGVLTGLHRAHTIAEIIHGHATGADALADEWARSNHVTIRGFRAMWERDGKAAGPLRNQRMLDSAKPHLVLAFPGGKGTADMVARAEKAGVPVLRFPAQEPR